MVSVLLSDQHGQMLARRHFVSSDQDHEYYKDIQSVQINILPGSDQNCQMIARCHFVCSDQDHEYNKNIQSVQKGIKKIFLDIYSSCFTSRIAKCLPDSDQDNETII